MGKLLDLTFGFDQSGPVLPGVCDSPQLSAVGLQGSDLDIGYLDRGREPLSVGDQRSVMVDVIPNLSQLLVNGPELGHELRHDLLSSAGEVNLIPLGLQ